MQVRSLTRMRYCHAEGTSYASAYPVAWLSSPFLTRVYLQRLSKLGVIFRPLFTRIVLGCYKCPQTMDEHELSSMQTAARTSCNDSILFICCHVRFLHSNLRTRLLIGSASKRFQRVFFCVRLLT
jgi:hypothetical protein